MRKGWVDAWGWAILCNEANQSLPASHSGMSVGAEDRKDSCKLSHLLGVPEVPSRADVLLCLH